MLAFTFAYLLSLPRLELLSLFLISLSKKEPYNYSAYFVSIIVNFYSNFLRMGAFSS